MYAPPIAKPKTASRMPDGVACRLPPVTGRQGIPGQHTASWDFGTIHAMEQEADRVAAQVLRSPLVTRPNALNRSSAGATDTPHEYPADVQEALRSPAQPLDTQARGFFEERFGLDLGHVRIRTGERAAQSTRSLDAAAYTVGDDIVFSQGRYEPALARGRALLAHELAHVAQQANGARMLARQTVEQYQTAGTTSSATNLDDMATWSYWEQKVLEVFALATDRRMNANPEERDAVLAVLWQLRPTSAVKTATTQIVRIPKRSATTKDVVYQITFTPRKTPKEKDGAETSFVSEGAGTAAVTAPAVVQGTTPTDRNRSEGGFPQNDSDAYWTAHPEERARIFNWIDTASGAFDQIVTTSTSSAAQKGTTRSATFHVKGTKAASGDVTGLVITFVGATAPTTQAPDAGYASHDYADLLIEGMQTQGDPKTHDKLGTISGVSTLPADEQFSVKHSVYAYFKTGTRNAEVDAIVPIAQSAAATTPRKRVLYTFRFRPAGNDVDVVRIGEEGKDISLATQGSLQRVNGFSANSKDVPTLRAWLKKRYPGVTPSGTTLDEVQASVNEEIKKKSDSAAWYKTNYGIDVLDATAAETRLRVAHGYLPGQMENLKEFTATELPVLEVAVEAMSLDLVRTLTGLQVARQKVDIDAKGKPPKFVPNPKLGGLTLTTGSDRTIIIFDTATINAEALFLGGVGPGNTRVATVETAMTFEHEIGHTIANRPGVKAAFDDFVKAKAAAKKPIKPITWYAASDPAKELFPEAFALYESDPVWLKENSPDLYGWVDTLSTTGSPPPP